MRTIKSIAVGAVVLIAGGSAVAAAGATSSSTTSPPVRDVQGCVVGVHRDAHTFRVRDRSRGILTVKVTTRTRFENMAGFPALRNRSCLHIHAQRSGNVWQAVSIAPATKQAASQTQSATPDRDQDRIQARDRDGTCDGDQIQDRDQIRDRISR